MGAEEKRESRRWASGAENRTRGRCCWLSPASETFLDISIQTPPSFCAEDLVLSPTYIIMSKIFGGECKTFHEPSSNSHFHVLSLSVRGFTLHYQLPPSTRCPECPFIWIGVSLFEYIDLFQHTIIAEMDISWPVIPSLGQADQKNVWWFYTFQNHLQTQVPFSCLWLLASLVVCLKKSRATTDGFMQKEGAEPLKAASVTQVLKYFSPCVRCRAFPRPRTTARWLAGVWPAHVYVVLFMRLDPISAKSWFVSL